MKSSNFTKAHSRATYIMLKKKQYQVCSIMEVESGFENPIRCVTRIDLSLIGKLHLGESRAQWNSAGKRIVFINILPDH